MGNTIRCNDCGQENESGRAFCKRCSGNLYRNQYREKAENYLTLLF